MMSKRRIATLALSIVIFSAAALVLVQKRGARSLSPQEMDAAVRDSLMEPGSDLPDLPLKTPNGDSSLVQLVKGRWTFVLFRKELRPVEFDFPEVVVARAGDSNVGFLFIGDDTPVNRSVAKDYTNRSGRSSIEFAFEHRGAFNQAFALPNGTPASSLLSTPDARCVFSVPSNLRDAIVRQLTERYVLKQRTLDLYSPPKGLKPGEPVPDVALTDIKTKTHTRLRDVCQSPCKILFFPADCTRCGMGTLLEELQNVSAETGGFHRARIVPIFSH